MRALLACAVTLTLIIPFSCKCTSSYALICDSVSDYVEFGQTSRIPPDVIIESKASTPSQLEFLNFGDFEDIVSLTIVNRLLGILHDPYKTHLIRSTLKYVNLYHNRIKKIGQNVFPDFSTIYKMKLANNRIGTIDSGAFARCEPEIVDLSDNQIEIIESGTFTSRQSKNRTRAVILENNKLVTIEANSFPPTLQLLMLSNNELSFVDPQVFKNLLQLKGLGLSKNMFASIPNLQFLTKLEVLDLSYNRIRTIGAEAFSRQNVLQVLDLSHNKLSQIHENTFRNTQKLSDIDLSFNQIQQTDFLLPFRDSFLRVSLTFNHIRTLFGERFKKMKNQFLSISFYGNPFSCKEWISNIKRLNEIGATWDYDDSRFSSSGKVPFCVTDLRKCRSNIQDYCVSESGRILFKNDAMISKFLNITRNLKEVKNSVFADMKSNKYRDILHPDLAGLRQF